jgi:hypothetical protein
VLQAYKATVALQEAKDLVVSQEAKVKTAQ